VRFRDDVHVLGATLSDAMRVTIHEPR